MNFSESNAMFLGNNAALDLINTQFIQRGAAVDLLNEEADLEQWAQQIDRTVLCRANKKNLSAAKALRSALHDLFLASMESTGLNEQSMKVVNRHLAEHSSREMLGVNANDELQLVADESASTLPALFAKIAYAGAKLLASPQISHVKRCNNPDCILLFLDTSRSKKRRWCSMETCGNRAKVAKHYKSQNQV